MCILTVVLMLINLLIDNFAFDGNTLHFGYWIIFIFSFITQIAHKVLLNLLEKQPNKFPLLYQLITMGKIFIYFVIALAYVLYNKDQALAFLVLYAVCYLVFLIAETSSMSGIVRKYQTKAHN